MKVILETNAGEITIELLPKLAPKSCENFSTHVKNGYYDNLIFHRVIKDFMIQGGDPTGTGMGGESIWGEPFEDECSDEVKFDKPYLLAMANAGPNTNGSQFFITTAATPWLNNNHTIFGVVVDGKDTIKAIEATKTGAMDKPIEDQKIIKATLQDD